MKTTTEHKTLLNFIQFRQELESFRRQMNFIKEENIYLKNRLSEVLKETEELDLLEELEIFQSKFLHYDMIISIARNDIAGLETTPDNGLTKNEDIGNKALQQLTDMRTGFLTLITEFSNLKTEFNSFLLEKI